MMTFSMEVEPSVLTVPVTSVLLSFALSLLSFVLPQAAKSESAISAARVMLISFFI